MNRLACVTWPTMPMGKDHGSREDYVAKFLDHIDWDKVSRRYRAVDRK